MAQVTYRGVKYDTTERKQAQTHKVQETYRGVKFNKELVTAQSLTYQRNKQGFTPLLF